VASYRCVVLSFLSRTFPLFNLIVITLFILIVIIIQYYYAKIILVILSLYYADVSLFFLVDELTEEKTSNDHLR
jgi:hypothetical protein